MFCKNCGAAISDDSVFCPFCGQKVEAEPIVDPTPTFSSAFRQAGSLGSSGSGMGAPVEARKPAASQEDTGLRSSSGFKRAENLSAESTSDELVLMPEAHESNQVLRISSGFKRAKDLLEESSNDESVAIPVTAVWNDADDNRVADTEEAAPTDCCPPCSTMVDFDDESFNNYDKKNRHFDSNAWQGFFAKNKKPVLIGLAICCALLLIVFSLFGVGDNKVSKRLIEEDITEYCSMFLNSAGMRMSSIKIIDRKTDVDNKTDEVFVQVVSSNDVCKVTRNFTMHYYKYDDGWNLESVKSGAGDLEILKATATEAEAKTALQTSGRHDCLTSGKITLFDHNVSLAQGTDVFKYKVTVPKAFCTENYTAIVTYKFKGYSWALDTCEVTQEKSDWKFIGEWHYNAGDATVWINVISHDQGVYELEFSLQYNRSGWIGSNTRKIDSGGRIWTSGEENTDFEGNLHLNLDLEGYNEDGELVDAGWLEVYPNSGPRWDDIGAVNGPFRLQSGSGTHNSTDDRMKLGELFAESIGTGDYRSDSITDRNGKTYDGFFKLKSYFDLLRLDTKIEYDLKQEYTTFTGTYFYDPEYDFGDTIRVEIYCDGKLVFDTGELDPDSPVSEFSIDITGVNELTIWARSSSQANRWDEDYHVPIIYLVDAYLER